MPSEPLIAQANKAGSCCVKLISYWCLHSQLRRGWELCYLGFQAELQGYHQELLIFDPQVSSAKRSVRNALKPRDISVPNLCGRFAPGVSSSH